jgi:hypothetical protein
MFTLVLAFSTVGLWIATIGLYFAGERQLTHAQSVADSAERDRKSQLEKFGQQIGIAQQNADAASLSADAAVAAERARFYVVVEHNFLACVGAAKRWDGPIEQDENPLPSDIQPMAGIRFEN